MADARITDLAVKTSPANTDVLVIVENPASSPVAKQITLLEVFRAVIGTLTAWTTPVAADLLYIYDSTNNLIKKIVLSDLIQSGLFKVLTADDTGGQNVNTAQPWFPTAGGVTVAANKTYRFRGQLRLSRAAGTTSHTTGLLFGGTAVVSNIKYTAISNNGDVAATTAAQITQIEVATNTAVKGASTSATEQAVIEVSGVIRIGTGGTLIPQFIYSAAPGGTPTVLRNTFFELIPLGADTIATQGTWA